MGWTTYHATHYKNGKIDRKTEIESCVLKIKERDDISILKSAMVGNTYYAAVKDLWDGKIYAVIICTKVSGRQFAYNCFDETMLPTERKCPKGILNMLSKTDNARANEWRASCCETAKALTLSDIPVGGKIKVKIGSSTYILTKNAPSYQFKTPFWLTDSGRYISKNNIVDWEPV